jgi:hypothetical protein
MNKNIPMGAKISGFIVFSLLVLTVYKGCNPTVNKGRNQSDGNESHKEAVSAQEIRYDVTIQLKGNVRASLKDGESAKIHDAVLYLSDREPDGVSGFYTLCGVVNGKNSYGAYAGDTGFVSARYLKMVNGVWQQGSDLLVFDGPDTGTDAPDYATMYKRMCHDSAKQ